MISIVAPAYNEEANVRPFVEAVMKVLDRLEESYEILIVDDGSSDSTASVVRSFCQEDARVKLIRLSRNFGHQCALTAGLDHARGDSIIMMDIDLQHPPALIEELIRARNKGFEVVNTRRREDPSLSFFKRFTSLIYYKIFNALSETKIEPNSSDYRLLSRRALDELKGLGERVRFVRGLTVWIGFRSTVIDYEPERRLHGRSKYSLKKMFRLALDGVTSFSTRPLKLLAFYGLVVTTLSIFYAVYALVQFANGRALPGWASILISVLLMGGVQMLGMGILGIYIGKIFEEVKHRPLYIVTEAIGLNR